MWQYARAPLLLLADEKGARSCHDLWRSLSGEAAPSARSHSRRGLKHRLNSAQRPVCFCSRAGSVCPAQFGERLGARGGEMQGEDRGLRGAISSRDGGWLAPGKVNSDQRQTSDDGAPLACRNSSIARGSSRQAPAIRQRNGRNRLTRLSAQPFAFGEPVTSVTARRAARSSTAGLFASGTLTCGEVMVLALDLSVPAGNEAARH